MAILGIVVALSGCITSTNYRALQPVPGRMAVNPDSVQVYYIVPQRKFEVIGVITAEGSILASDAKYERAMRKKAAEVGADAIIITDGDVVTTGATAVATSPTTAIAMPYQYYGTRAYAILFKD